MPTQRLRRVAIRTGSLIIAGFLVYLSLRRTDLADIGTAFSQARYWWCIPLAVVTIGSHLVRAWRWQALLEALPVATRRPSLATAFGSVMIGFMINYVLPRMGEFFRAANLSRRERLPYSGVLGTVVTERVIDVGTLAIGLALSAFFLTEAQRAHMYELMLAPALDWLASVPMVGLVAALLVALALAWWVAAKTPVRRLVSKHLAPFGASFLSGLVTVHRSPRKVLLVASTIAIWLMYGLMAYIPLEMFSIAAPHGLTLVDAMVIMFVGVLGVLVPTPGGAGSFHYITVLTLTGLYGVSRSLALTYAVFVHGAQLILYLFLGLLVVLLQDTKVAQLRSDVRKPYESLD